MSEPETIRCNWCGRSRKPSAYAGDDHFPRLLDICQWCRGVETRRNGAKPQVFVCGEPDGKEEG